MRIGLLGGSFNPVHNAHLRIAMEAQKACSLDKIVFIPAADPPHKLLEGDISFECRAHMVTMAIADCPDFEMSTIEAERGGKSYSIDTIRAFRERFPHDDLYFIIGGDSLRDIGTWHRYEEIFSSCHLIIVMRPGCPIPNPIDVLPEDVRGKVSRDGEAGQLKHESGNSLIFITGSPLDISSTEIRRLAAAGKDITQYVPSDIAAYISTQRIYHTCL